MSVNNAVGSVLVVTDIGVNESLKWVFIVTDFSVAVQSLKSVLIITNIRVRLLFSVISLWWEGGGVGREDTDLIDESALLISLKKLRVFNS